MGHASAAAIHANMLHADRRVAALGPRGVARQLASWLIIDPGIDFPLFNMALVLGDPPPDPGAALLEAERWFERRGLAHHRFVLRAGADAALIAAARSAGLATGHEMPSMALEPLPGAPPPLPEGLRIRPVDDEADLALYTAQFIGADPEWDQVVKAIGRTAMSLPGFTLLLGLCDGEPVATSMAVVTGATVGIYNVGVDPRYRRRGFGSAMSLAAMAAGAAEGCRLAGLQASEMGYSMYEGLGFRTVETYLSMERT